MKRIVKNCYKNSLLNELISDVSVTEHLYCVVIRTNVLRNTTFMLCCIMN